MKEINCNIIKDILPLYVDDVVSQDTKELVDEHLEHCENCRQEAAVMKKEMKLPVTSAVRIQDAELLKKLKKSIKSKRVRLSMISILLTIAVWLGMHVCLIDITWFVPYESKLVSVETTDGKVYAKFNRDSYAGIFAINPYTVEINGEEKNIVIFYYEDNLWAKHIEPLYMDKENNDTAFYLGNEDEIDEIYYGEFPDVEIYERLPAFLEDKEMIWNR